MPSTPAQVAVVIPTRNRPALLERSLACALGQRDVDTEIVVVDDGSEPAVGPDPDPRVRVVRNRAPRGVAGARNRGIREATAPWVAFLDDDDLWAPGKLAAQLAALRADPAAGWSYTGEAILDTDLTVVWGNRAPLADEIGSRLLRGNAVPGGGSSVVAARDLLLDLGGFDESFSILADWDLWTRLSLRARAAPVADPLVGYVLHPTAMSRDVERSRAEFARIDLKYRAVRAARGVPIGLHDYLMYLADLDRRGGRRGRAARLSVEAARAEGDPRAFLYALATLCWPGFGRAIDRRSRSKYPPDERAAVEEWAMAAARVAVP